MSVVYEIGPFRLAPGVGVLTCEGAAVPLGPRAIAVLTALVEGAQGYVSKDRLLEAGWPGLVVEENNLSVHISAIRRALSRAPGGEGWIETLSRRGYRFVGPVVERRAAAWGDAAPPSSLPRPLTSFIGREQELGEVGKLLRGQRLVTIVGVGGIGKTRLALEVADRAQGDYADGAWFVDLASIGHEDAVPEAVARALKVREEGGRALMETVTAQLQRRQLLLVLDNCEHVLKGAAKVVDMLLRAAPALRILTTTRESLHVDGEQVYAVPSLSLPGVGEEMDPARSDAVRLFLVRARLRQPDFAFDQEAALAIAKLCRRLDGLPLALELAAARLEALPLETIMARLDDRLRLLAAGSRSAMPRQQTLRGAIEWSHELLSAVERNLFARLAIFEGGWTLVAAENVAGAVDPATSEVLDVMTRLVEKSLVVAERESGRYRMLDTIREFAREKFAELPEREALVMRYLDFYVGLAEEAERGMFSRHERQSLARYEADIDNILAACASCRHVENGAEFALRLAVATRPFWLTRGLLRIGVDVCVAAVEFGAGMPASASLAGAYVAAAQTSHYVGRNEAALAYAMKGRELARATAHLGWEALALNQIAEIAREKGDLPAARAHSEKALEVALESGSERRVAGVLNSVAELHRAEGRLDDAIAVYERALSISRRLEAGEYAAVILVNLATAMVTLEQPALARKHLAEALPIIRGSGIKVAGWGALEVAAMVAGATREWSRAARLHGAVESQREELSLQSSLHDERLARRFLQATRSALGEASFAAAHSAGRSASYDQIVAETADWLAGAADT